MKANQELITKFNEMDKDFIGNNNKKNKIILQRLNLVAKLSIRSIRDIGSSGVGKELKGDKKLDFILLNQKKLIKRLDELEIKIENTYISNKVDFEKTIPKENEPKFIPKISTNKMTIKADGRKKKILKKNLDSIAKEAKKITG